jgi:hypothetical protein
LGKKDVRRVLHGSYIEQRACGIDPSLQRTSDTEPTLLPILASMDLPLLLKRQAARRFGDFPEKQALPIIFLVIVPTLSWLPRISDSLFVDEAASFWSVEDGLAEGVRRALSITGQSWFYTALLALWTSVFGTSEIALRMPSILAAVATCGLLILIGRDRNVVSPLLAAVLLALMPSMIFAATVARPYALGLFFSTLAISCLQSWTRRGHTAGLYGAVLTTLCALYCHPTFIALLFPILVVLTENEAYKHHPRDLFKASILFLVGLSPAVLLLTQVSREAISAVAIIEKLPSWKTLCFHFFSTPISLIVALILSLRITILRRPHIEKADSPSNSRLSVARFRPIPREELRFGLSLYLAPKLLTLLAAITVNPTLLVFRYSILSLVGEAYTASLLLSTIGSRFWRIGLSGVTIVSMLLPHFMASPPDTAWRPIIEESRRIVAREACTFFALVGFTESKHAELLTREPTRSFILSPLAYYKLGPAVLLPASVDSTQAQDYMARMVYPRIPSSPCNLILEWQIVDSSPSTMSGPQAIAHELSVRGCTKSSPLSEGLVTLTHWRCPFSS